MFNMKQNKILESAQYGHDMDRIRTGYGINKVLSLLNERGDPPFLFPNLSSYNTNNQ